MLTYIKSLLFKQEVTWKMTFGADGAFRPHHLPILLQQHYAWADSGFCTNYDPKHCLVGKGDPTQEVIEAISKHFNQYLELRMSDGSDSYVWPSDPEIRAPIRCSHVEAIYHFDCYL